MNYATSTNCIFPVIDFRELKNKVLNWASRFSTFCFLDNHQYDCKPHSFECVLAAGIIDSVEAASGNALSQFQKFIDNQLDSDGKGKWLFGHFGYGLKKETEGVPSAHIDPLVFPDLFFFQPEVLIRFDEKEMIIESEWGNKEKIWEEISAARGSIQGPASQVTLQSRMDREEYISIIQELRQHIVRGDCYEINFCQEFFAENAFIDPLSVYKKLSEVSPNPFSAFYRLGDKYLLCASPERFLKKTSDKIICQPIKGTSRRMENSTGDAESKRQLLKSPKERSENVMIVDLVRNDLSKICKEGTVRAEELYQVYSFPQVHQMISTISGELREDVSISEIIRASFPMGSMTGAPKKNVVELIERYEKSARGIYSGAVGYISPEMNFDFNVVIRSIQYDLSARYLSFQTGSGITFYSEAEKEWEECLLKAKAMKKVLTEKDPETQADY